MKTDSAIDTPASETSTEAHLIGIFIKLPPLTFWTPFGVESRMLDSILFGALRRRSLLVDPLLVIAFDRCVLSMAKVSKIKPALATVAQQLAALQLIDTHLAWADFPADHWQTERPLPEPMPFESRLQSLAAWTDTRRLRASSIEQADRIITETSALIEKLKKKGGSTP